MTDAIPSLSWGGEVEGRDGELPVRQNLRLLLEEVVLAPATGVDRVLSCVLSWLTEC
jgi:hypothetical protein